MGSTLSKGRATALDQGFTDNCTQAIHREEVTGAALGPGNRSEKAVKLRMQKPAAGSMSARSAAMPFRANSLAFARSVCVFNSKQGWIGDLPVQSPLPLCPIRPASYTPFSFPPHSAVKFPLQLVCSRVRSGDMMLANSSLPCKHSRAPRPSAGDLVDLGVAIHLARCPHIDEAVLSPAQIPPLRGLAFLSRGTFPFPFSS